MDEKYLDSLLNKFIHVDYTLEATDPLSFAGRRGSSAWEDGTLTGFSWDEGQEVFVLELINGTELTRIPETSIQKIYVKEKKE